MKSVKTQTGCVAFPDRLQSELIPSQSFQGTTRLKERWSSISPLYLDHFPLHRGKPILLGGFGHAHQRGPQGAPVELIAHLGHHGNGAGDLTVDGRVE